MSLDIENLSVMVFLLQLMFRLLCWWESMRVASDIPWKHSLIANFLFLWLLQFSHSFCSTDP